MNDILKTVNFRVGLIFVLLIAGATLCAGFIASDSPDTLFNPAQTKLSAPSSRHWFGTDQFGRDVFSRVLHGGRISLGIAFAVVTLSLLIGVGYGVVSGYIGGILDNILMRLLDVFLAFPVIFIAVTTMALFGTSLLWLIFVLILTSWMDVARLVRAETHSLKNQHFIVKAKLAGLWPLRIVFWHVLPNLLTTIVTVAVIRVADIILIESALSFLGLGVQPPLASWGSIISDGRANLPFAWWLIIFPGLALLLTIVGLYLTGEGLKSFKGV